jgi:hypothetical protein|tara:strand:- start:151 stop:297 length:147 start_codon:yes stop_codon:yes gene_type:complete
MNTEDILRKNVKELQEQLQLQYIKNKELTEGIFKLNKLINMLLGKNKK